MSAHHSSALVHTPEEVFSDPEALALGGFLAGYSGLTREAYALDLRQFAIWCAELHIRLFDAKRVHIEALLAISKRAVAHGRRSHVDCALLPASTATPNKKI